MFPVGGWLRCQIGAFRFFQGKIFSPQPSTFPAELRRNFRSMISEARLACAGLITCRPIGDLQSQRYTQI